MYFITTKRMLELCFSAHPNIQYRTGFFVVRPAAHVPGSGACGPADRRDCPLPKRLERPCRGRAVPAGSPPVRIQNGPQNINNNGWIILRVW